MLRIHILFHCTFIIILASITYTLSNLVITQSLIILYLSTWLAHHLYQLTQLEKTLNHRSIPNLPKHPNTFWGQLIIQFNQYYRIQEKHKKRLQQTLKRFQIASEAIPNGIILLNQDKQIEWCNHAALTHFELNPQNIRGSSLKKQLNKPEWQPLFNEIRQSNTPQEIRLSLPQHNGIHRHLRIIDIPLNPQLTLIISEDISQAEQLNATRTNFVANVSHELRTPLTIINGFLETLADYPNLPKEQQQHFIQLMQHESTRMLNLINDLLTLSTLENQQQEHYLVATNLSQLTHTLAQAGQHLSQGKHHIHTEITENIWINANQHDLYQALSNLVFNAIRYTPDNGHITLKLNLTSNPNPYKPPLAHFAVIDDGIGIAPEHIPHLTDRFYRVDHSRSRQTGGTGLGLAIAKHALARHNATLNIQSTPNQGSEFSTLFQSITPP